MRTAIAIIAGLALFASPAQADRLTQHEVQRVVRAWDRTWDTHSEIRGVHWLKPRVARVAVRWPFADIIIEDDAGRTVETAWLKEYVTVKDRGDQVGLWSPVLERWEWVR